jgi:hypothetical protein
LVFIFDCCRQPKNSAIAKGDDEQSAQAAEVAINAVNKGGAGLSGLATFILFGDRSFGFASDGGSATMCSVLTQAIVDTACVSGKITRLGQLATRCGKPISAVSAAGAAAPQA